MKNNIFKLAALLFILVWFFSGCYGPRYAYRDRDRDDRRYAHRHRHNHHDRDDRNY